MADSAWTEPLVLKFVTITGTFGMTAPVVSLTRPRIVPRIAVRTRTPREQVCIIKTLIEDSFLEGSDPPIETAFPQAGKVKACPPDRGSQPAAPLPYAASYIMNTFGRVEHFMQWMASFQAKKAAPQKKAAPAKKVAPAAAADSEAKVIAEIEKSGGSVRNLAQNDDRREVSFYLEGAKIKDAHLAPLASLKKVAQLHLGGTSVTDAGLVHLKGLTDLEQLHLEKTQITDKGLANLSGLKKLEYLNIYGTAVTDAGLEHLSSLANLKNLYVWQTKATDAGIEKLKKALPNCNVVKGW
jgi:hypothetical protein